MSAKSRLNVLFIIVYLNKSEVRTYDSSGMGKPPKSTLTKIRASRNISPFTNAMDKLPLRALGGIYIGQLNDLY